MLILCGDMNLHPWPVKTLYFLRSNPVELVPAKAGKESSILFSPQTCPEQACPACPEFIEGSVFILSFVEVVEWEESIRKSLRVLVKEAADLFCIGMYILSDSVLLNLTVCQIVRV